jgi:hypothetical protein
MHLLAPPQEKQKFRRSVPPAGKRDTGTEKALINQRLTSDKSEMMPRDALPIVLIFHMPRMGCDHFAFHNIPRLSNESGRTFF